MSASRRFALSRLKSLAGNQETDRLPHIAILVYVTSTVTHLRLSIKMRLNCRGSRSTGPDYTCELHVTNQAYHHVMMFILNLTRAMPPAKHCDNSNYTAEIMQAA